MSASLSEQINAIIAATLEKASEFEGAERHEHIDTDMVRALKAAAFERIREVMEKVVEVDEQVHEAVQRPAERK